MPTSNIQVLTKTELQEDWYSHTTLGSPSTSGGLAINLDGNGKLSVSFLNDQTVMSAHRSLDKDGNALRTWTVEDTLFPSSTTPTFLDSILAPSNSTYLAALGQDNNIYVLDCSSKFPRWKTCHNKTGKTPTKLSIFTTRKAALRIAVFMSNGSIQVLNPLNNKWFEDKAIKYNAAPVYDYKVSSAFTQTSDKDNSLWGYVVSGGVWGRSMEAGVAVIAADQNGATTRTIHQGKYTSVAYVAIGGDMPRTTPLVFGIDDSKRVTYFQAQGDGSFSTAFPFGTDSQFTYMDAIFRTGPDASQNATEWVDLYALDASGNLWHTRNAEYETGRFTAVKRLSNGDIVVPEWETPSIISSQSIKSFDLTMEVSGAGHAYVVTELSANSTTSLQCHIQDISSTDWTTSPIATVDHAEPEVIKRNIYYVEMTVRNDGVLAPGLAVRISAPEYCQIDANGVSTSVSSGQPYSTTTNARGLLCLTIPATESLACPALSVWVEGMEARDRIDVQPTGKIQQRYANITVDDLKKAKDQTDQSLVFGDLEDSQLRDLKTSLNQIATSFSGSPTTSESTAAQDSTGSNVSRNRYLHPKSLAYVSATRNTTGRHMGLISHSTSNLPKPFRIHLRPAFSIELLEHPIAQENSADSIFSSWGDFWTQVTNGLVEVKDMAFNAVENGVKTVVNCVINGANKVWKGIAQFARQAFDAIGDLFRSLKVKAIKLFNWLAYIFAWGDIKATAVAFRSIVDDSISKSESYIKHTVRGQLDSFFTQAKSWVSNNMDSALTGSDKFKIGDNDKPESDPSNDLPSSSSWLSNKVENSAGSAGLDQVASVNDDFTSTIQTFMNNFNSTGISDDLSKAIQDASAFFQTLTSRGAIDQLTFQAFMKVFQDLAVLSLDLVQAVVDTLLDALVHALAIFKDALNTPLDIPIISKIFKEIVGLDLTFFNLIAVPMAIPVTILYKMMIGGAPFSSSSGVDKELNGTAAAGTLDAPKKDIPLFFSGVFSLIYGVSDLLLDLYTAEPKASGDPLVRYLSFGSIFSLFLVMGAGAVSAPTNARTQYALDVSIIGTSVSAMVVIFDFANRKYAWAEVGNQLMDVFGMVVPFFSGLLAFGSGAWHVVNILDGSEEGNWKDWQVVFAELIGPLAGIGKIGKFAQQPEYNGVILPLIDLVSCIGATISYTHAALPQ